MNKESGQPQESSWHFGKEIDWFTILIMKKDLEVDEQVPQIWSLSYLTYRQVICTSNLVSYWYNQLLRRRKKQMNEDQSRKHKRTKPRTLHGTRRQTAEHYDPKRCLSTWSSWSVTVPTTSSALIAQRGQANQSERLTNAEAATAGNATAVEAMIPAELQKTKPRTFLLNRSVLLDWGIRDGFVL